MNDKNIGRLIGRKTGVYLKISVLLFSLSLFSLATFYIYVQYQRMQTNYNFIDNPNTHIVEVEYKNDQNSNDIYNLSFTDQAAIEKILEGFGKCLLYYEYNINFGMPDPEGGSFFVKSISDYAMDRLGIEKIKDDMAYCSNEVKRSEVSLQIPCIDVAEGGFSSTKSTDASLELIALDTIVKPFSEMKHFHDILYVNENTFKKMIEGMYGTSWDSFVNDYESGKPTGIQLIGKIYLYAEDIKNVKQIALKLEKEGYVNECVLNAFDDLSSSINTNNLLLIGMLAVILLLTMYNVINSFQGYIYNLQKDIGVLIHYGYSNQRAYHIYKGCILKPCIFITPFLLAYIVILSIVLLQREASGYVLQTILLMAFILGAVAIKLLFLLRQACDKNVLILLKAPPQSE